MYCFTRSGSAKNPIQRRAVALAPWRFSAGTYAGISRAEIPLRDLRQQIYATAEPEDICWLRGWRGLRSRRVSGVLTLSRASLQEKNARKRRNEQTFQTVAG
jgi:hypothetical protein